MMDVGYQTHSSLQTYGVMVYCDALVTSQSQLAKQYMYRG